MIRHHNFRHGESIPGKVTSEYMSYTSARTRCVNTRNQAFKDYGGRDIKFLFKSFQEFLAHIGRKPSAKYVLDRIDNNGHYEPGNVRWATRSESMKNRRITPKFLRAVRRNLLSAREVMTPKRRRASRRNLIIARSVPMTPKKLRACMRNIKKARKARKLKLRQHLSRESDSTCRGVKEPPSCCSGSSDPPDSCRRAQKTAGL